MKIKLCVWGRDDEYVDATIEDLATELHEMAAVAWDRDCEAILGRRQLHGEWPLRFLVEPGVHAICATGEMGRMNSVIAWWDHVELRWTLSKVTRTQH